jgi:hypothetical protein
LLSRSLSPKPFLSSLFYSLSQPLSLFLLFCLKEAIAAAAAALTILDGVDIDHAHDAALADVSTALRDMDYAVCTFNPAWLM